MDFQVFQSILAMDSYNRGYGANVKYDTGPMIGNATFLTDSTTQLGLAATRLAGFYASAYNWNGRNVISYRGTNPDFTQTSLSDFLNSPGIRDVWNGWTLGAGFAGASQGRLAIEFYNEVAGVDTPYYLIELPASSTLLLGHSLGGGLAGFVGALSGENSAGYDHMPFGVASYAQSISDSIAAASEATGISLEDLRQIFSAISLLPTSFITGTITVQEFLNAFEDEFMLRAPLISMSGTSTDGEALSFVRAGLPQVAAGILGAPLTALMSGPMAGLLLPIVGVALGYTTAELETGPNMSATIYNVHGATLSVVERHSMPLLTTLIYGEQQWQSEGGAGRATDWHGAAPYILPALFDREIGEGLGRVQDANGGGTGAADPAAQVATAIAYSAINEGTRVFGDTGIRALFDDASDLGRTLPASSPLSLRFAAMGIGGAITEYAGLLAVNRIIDTPETALTDGIVSIHFAPRTGAQTMFIDFRASTWDVDGAGALTAHDSVKQDELIEGFIDADGGGAIILPVIESWYQTNGTSITHNLVQDIDRISVSLSFGGQLAQLPGSGLLLSVLSDSGETRNFIAGADFVIGGTGADKLSGNAGNDILLGGYGNDELKGGAGKDFLHGGVGIDTLFGGSGNDTLYAGLLTAEQGDGQDKLYGEAGNDLLNFNNSRGIASGGLGNDRIDARKSFGLTIEYAVGDGRDMIIGEYSFDIRTLSFANVETTDLRCRGDSTEVQFRNLITNNVYIVWNVVVLESRQFGGADSADLERLVHGNMSVYTLDNVKIMDIGDVIGINYLIGGSSNNNDILNAPDLIFTDGSFSASEGSNVDLRINFQRPSASPSTNLEQFAGNASFADHSRATNKIQVHGDWTYSDHNVHHPTVEHAITASLFHAGLFEIFA